MEEIFSVGQTGSSCHQQTRILRLLSQNNPENANDTCEPTHKSMAVDDATTVMKGENDLSS